MLSAKPAILLILDPARLFALILCGRVIPVLTDRAFERNNVSHKFSYG